jgi:hypothetical protein
MITQATAPRTEGVFSTEEQAAEEQVDRYAWTSNDWETPDPVSRFLGSLIVRTDRVILEPAAGRGQLLRYLPQDAQVFAYEVKPQRVADGIRDYPWAMWSHQDFLTSTPPHSVDVVVSNPPFEWGVEFVEKALGCLDPQYRSARCLFLLPSDYWQSHGRFDRLAALDCHIHREYKIRGRVAYLKEGIPESNRQCYDSVFDIRPGRQLGGVVMVDPREDRL